MAKNKAKMNKFLTGAITATMVATAVAPVASAASFTDTDKLDSNVKAEVDKAVELGFFKDAPKFNPADSINRSQAALTLARYIADGSDTEALKAYVEENKLEDTVAAFEDVPASFKDGADFQQEIYYASLIVKDAGAFTQNNLTPTGDVTRSQMAKIITQTFGLEKAEGYESDLTDISHLDDETKGYIETIASLGVTNVKDFRPAGTLTRSQMASFLVRAYDVVHAEAHIASVSAINKTKVEVKFNTAVDSAKAADFTIEGASVTAVDLSEDKKTATLTVSGLEYGKKYSVSAELPVAGEITEFAAKEFTTPAVSDLWDLKVEAQDASLTANGADNTQVTFKLVDKVTGQVDENADNVVLKVSTTRGTLSNERITIQDGKGTTTLTSEFSNTNVTAKIDAQIIEASGDYNELIGKVVGTANVNFKVTSTEDVTIKTLVAAESNQADRVTLFFDNNVNLTDFVETTLTGSLLYNVVEADGATAVAGGTKVTGDTAKELQKQNPGSLIFHAVKDHNGTLAVDVAQAGTSSEIQGFKPVTGNSNAMEVILVNPNIQSTPGTSDFPALTDNQKVDVTANISNSLNKVTESKADFVLTDARNPEVTSVKAEGMNKVVVQFSESVANGDIRFDGLVASNNNLVGGSGTENAVELGEFNALTLQDTRDVATITLEDAYTKANYGGPADGYFKAGSHSIQVSNLVDHAYATDSNNKGTTQTLQFTVKDDKTLPTAKVVTQSPEQFIVNFDKVLKNDITTLANNDYDSATPTLGVRLEVFDPETEEWGNVVDTTEINGETVFTSTQQTIELTHITGGEYKVEVEEDWKDVLANANDHYSNYKFRLAVDKGAAVNEANGLVNTKALYLDLGYSGSALTKVDNTSPVIKDIQATTNAGEYVVELSEPIKAANLASPHNGFQVTGDMAVKFQGKDKDGKTVEFEADILGYNNAYDTEVLVKWKATGTAPNEVTPQTIVDNGGSETWTVVATSVADDIGNTASTLTKDFTLKKTPESAVPFTIENVEYDVAAADNKIKITFSTAVQHTGGVNDATALAHYTLNGLNLPAGSSVAVAQENLSGDEGYDAVIITVPEGTLAQATPGTAAGTDTISINKNLVDKKGVKLTGQYEWVVQ